MSNKDYPGRQVGLPVNYSTEGALDFHVTALDEQVDALIGAIVEAVGSIATDTELTPDELAAYLRSMVTSGRFKQGGWDGAWLNATARILDLIHRDAMTGDPFSTEAVYQAVRAARDASFEYASGMRDPS